MNRLICRLNNTKLFLKQHKKNINEPDEEQSRRTPA